MAKAREVSLQEFAERIGIDLETPIERVAPLDPKNLPAVEVGVFVRPPPANTKFVRVIVRGTSMIRVGGSPLKPTFGRRSMFGDVEAGIDNLEREVMLMGGALAEELAGRFGDKVEPSEMARLALEAFREVRADLEKGGTLIEGHGLLDPNGGPFEESK